MSDTPVQVLAACHNAPSQQALTKQLEKIGHIVSFDVVVSGSTPATEATIDSLTPTLVILSTRQPENNVEGIDSVVRVLQRYGSRLIVLADTLEYDTYQALLAQGVYDALPWEAVDQLPWLVLRGVQTPAAMPAVTATEVPATDTNTYEIELRQRAEQEIIPLDELWEMNAQDIIHELYVHREELIIQLEDLRQAHDELNQLRQEYEILFHDAPVGYVIIDTNGRVVKLNTTFQAMLGLQASPVGQMLASLMVTDDQDRYYLHQRRVMQTGVPETVEITFRREDRPHLTAQVATRPDAHDSRLLRTVILDMSETHQARQALEQAQAIAHLGSWTLDFETNETRWSDEFFRICGLEPGEVNETVELGVSLIHPDDRERAAEAVATSRESGQPYRIEKRIVRPDGDIRWVVSQGEVQTDTHGQPRMLVGTFLDITERQRSLKRLRALHNIDKGILRATSIEEIGRHALADLSTIMPSFRQSLIIMQGDTRQAVIMATRTQADYTTLPAGAQVTITPEKHNHLQQHPYLLVTDLAEQTSDEMAALYAEGVRSVLFIALKYEGQLIGLLNLHGKTEHHFQRDDLDIPLEIADQLAIAVKTTQLRQELKAYAVELEERVEARTAELQYSKQRYRQTIESMTEGLAVQDASGKISICNSAAERILGLSADQMMGRASIDPRWRAIHEDGSDFPGDAHPAMVALKTGHPQRSVVMGVHKPDGSLTWIEVNAEPIKQTDPAAPKAVVSTFTDITARKGATRALRESEEKFRQIAENTEQVIFVFSADGVNIEYVSPAYETLWGQTPDELKDNPAIFAERVHPDDRQRVMTRTMDLESRDIEYRIIQPDGMVRWVWARRFDIHDDEGAVVKRIGIVEDITKLKQAELNLQAVTERLQLALEAGNIGVWEHNLQTGRVQVDARNLQTYGFESEEGMEFDSFDNLLLKYIHPDDLNYIASNFEAALAGTKPYNVEFRIRHPDGNMRYIRANAVVIRGEDGTPQRMVGVSLDITKVREAENSLRATIAREQELGELKSRFVSMASHEFRTPLATISATTETLLAYRARMDDSQLTARLNKITDQVEYMTGIIDDVLQLARIQSGRLAFKPEPGDLAALCRDVLDGFNSQPAYQGRIVFQREGEAARVTYDPRLMRQAINNLVSNALKYTPSGEAVSIKLVYADDGVTLTVVDRGIGIPAADLPRLFEPFHRASNVGAISGTGLGLSITSESIEKHSGHIGVESVLNAGTTFTVTLPYNPPTGQESDVTDDNDSDH